MEQRPLRLGDHVDDYCPRERRITNHVIAAIVGDTIKQTRCTTCDADHVYREGRAPRRRKKEPAAELFDQVLQNAGGVPAIAKPANEPAPDARPEPAVNGGPAHAAAPAEESPAESPANGQPPGPRHDEVWSGHRPLIRATLPRTENDQPPPRPIPEFTMHQRHGRGGHGFRQGNQWASRNGGQGGGQHDRNGFRGPGQGHGQGRPRRHGKKRPR